MRTRLTTKQGIRVTVDNDQIDVQGGPTPNSALGWAIAYGDRLALAGRRYTLDYVQGHARLDVMGVFEDALAADVGAYVAHGEPPIHPHL